MNNNINMHINSYLVMYYSFIMNNNKNNSSNDDISNNNNDDIVYVNIYKLIRYQYPYIVRKYLL